MEALFTNNSNKRTAHHEPNFSLLSDYRAWILYSVPASYKNSHKRTRGFYLKNIYKKSYQRFEQQ